MAGKAEIHKKADIKVANDKNLNLAISGINKQFGPGALMKLGDATKMEVDKISTGSIAIDLALGIGGLPKGRVCEIYGPESSGKTTFCLSIIAQAQKQGEMRYLLM